MEEGRAGFFMLDMKQMKVVSTILSAALLDMERGHIPLAVVMVTVPEDWKSEKYDTVEPQCGVQTYVHNDVQGAEALEEIARMIRKGLLENTQPLPPLPIVAS